MTNTTHCYFFLRTSMLLCLLMVLAGAELASAQVTGINYTISPIGSRVYWSDDAALDDGYFYGGELGLGFGEYFEVSGIYLLGNNFETNFSNLSGADEATLEALSGLAAREVQVRRYGGKLRINLGADNLVPFLTAGTGILRFDPDDLGDTETIYANVGAGATFSLADRYTISIAVENLIYRYNAGLTFFSEDDLAQVGLTPADFNQQTVYNPAVSASVKVYLGGRGAGELTEVDRALVRQFRGGGFQLAVEPFYGQINFNDELDFPETQAVAGVQAGVDLGPYIGVRGFYWRALEQEKAFEDGLETSFTRLAFYGGELNLRFGSEFVQGITPYLVLGGGYANVGDEYQDFSGFRPASRYFAIGGGGIEVPLSSAIKLQAGLRGLFMSTQDIEDVSDPGSVFSSLMYTGGINFNLGGNGRTPGDVLAREREETRTRSEALEAELAMLRTRLDSLEQTRQRPPRGEFIERPVSERLGQDTVVVAGRAMAGRTITVPVPEEGEIYIRFGAPEGETIVRSGMPFTVPADTAARVVSDTMTVAGGLTAGQIRAIVQQAVAEQQTETRLTAEDLDASLQAMENRLEQRIAEETRQLRAGQGQPANVTVVQDRPGTTTGTGDATLVQTFQQRELAGVLPVIGVRLGEGSDQFLVGVRGDYRFPGRTARLVPELALAFGDGVGLSALGNIVYPFGAGFTPFQVQPYAGAGVGFVTDSGLSGLDLTLNLLAGAEYTLGNGLTFFGEYSTLDFFDFNRFLVGYRWRF